jgi:hypothetical protein
VTDRPAELRINARRLRYAGVLSGAVVLVPILGIATVGHGLNDPPVLTIMLLLWLAGIVVVEFNARTVYVAIGDGQLAWRSFRSWRPEKQPINRINRVITTPKGDLTIYFSNGHKPLDLSAKEFRREDLYLVRRALQPVVT